MNERNHTTETLKAVLKDLQDGSILIVPFEKEEEEPHEVRTRKRLYSYGERAAALK